jgi:hypothetical protein
VKPDEIIPVALTDVTNHWAKDYVEVLSEKGIVTGFSDGTFRPDATLNRAELAVMLSRIISDYDEGSVVNFADVKSGDWFYEAVLKMSALGIVQGSDGSFMPYESVTRETGDVTSLLSCVAATGCFFLSCGSCGIHELGKWQMSAK